MATAAPVVQPFPVPPPPATQGRRGIGLFLGLGAGALALGGVGWVFLRKKEKRPRRGKENEDDDRPAKKPTKRPTEADAAADCVEMLAFAGRITKTFEQPMDRGEAITTVETLASDADAMTLRTPQGREMARKLANGLRAMAKAGRAKLRAESIGDVAAQNQAAAEITKAETALDADLQLYLQPCMGSAASGSDTIPNNDDDDDSGSDDGS